MRNYEATGMAKAAGLGAQPLARTERLDENHTRVHSGGMIGTFTIPLADGIVPVTGSIEPTTQPPMELYRDFLVARAYVLSGRGFQEVQDIQTLANINIFSGQDITFEQFQEIKQQAQEIANGTQTSEG